MIFNVIRGLYRSLSIDERKRIWFILLLAFLLRFISIIPHGKGITLPLRDQNVYYSLARAIIDDGHFGVPTDSLGPYFESRQQQPQPEGLYSAFHDSICAIWYGQGGYFYGVVEWGKPNSFYQPVYPLVCAGMYLLFGDNFFFWRLVHVLLGTFLVYFIYDIGKRAFKDEKIATIAALYACFYPHFIFYSWILMSEVAMMVLLAAGFWAYFRLLKHSKWSWAFLIGFFFALFVLTRSFLIFFFPIMLLFVLIFGQSRYRWQFTVLAALAFCLTMLPWWYRNYRLHDRFLLVSTRGGCNLWIRNNPYFIEDELKAMGVEFSMEKLDNLAHREYILGYPEFTKDQGEVERNKILTRGGIEFILSNPGFFLELCWNRFKWTIGYRSIGLRGPLLNGLSLIFYGPVLLGFLVSLFIGWKELKVTLPLWAVVGYFIVFYSLTHAGIRYRVPVDPFMILLAVYSFFFIYDRFIRKIPNSHPA